MIVAIDGPAGAGKSTVAQRVARELGFQLIDTGAMFRAVAWQALERGVDVTDGEALGEVARSLEFTFTFEGERNVVRCNGEVLGDEIRTQRVSEAASFVSAHPEVRQALLDAQRAIGRARSAVLEGRDIGTVVFPDAEVKVFLTATAAQRAERRAAQLVERGEDADVEQIRAEIEARDARDEAREHAPLKCAEDADPIDTTAMGIDEVVDAIVCKARGG